MFDVARPLLKEHNHLRKIYTSVRPYEKHPDQHDLDPVHPFKFLYEIWRSPRAAQYVKYANFEVSASRFSEQDYLAWKPDWREFVDECLQNSAYIQRARTPTNPQVQRVDPQFLCAPELWRKELLAGRSGSDIAILLTLLPNLERLLLRAHRHKSLWRAQLTDSIMDVNARDAVAGVHYPLSKLQTVIISETVFAYNKGPPIQNLAPFIALPSLRRLVGHDMAADDDLMDYHWPYGSHQSNLQEFELYNTITTSLQLRRILQPMRHLRAFRYKHSGALGWQVLFLDTAGYLRSIIDCVGSTLKDLTLTPPTKFYTAFESFKGFETLSRLEIRLKLLYGGATTNSPPPGIGLVQMVNSGIPDCLPQKSPPCPRLVDILPTTIKGLTLWVDSDESQTDRLFEGFSVSNSLTEILPRLRRVNLATKHKNIELERKVEELRDVGIKVFVYDWCRIYAWKRSRISKDTSLARSAGRFITATM
ncbi:MAG: hypothetical protein Q9209_004498 [Squamulea sp. 1 TL-2023]